MRMISWLVYRLGMVCCRIQIIIIIIIIKVKEITTITATTVAVEG